ncbi:MAG TPA: GHMP kinase [Methanocorpusculum sp.]|nr:GHMP kinase [Methanocorpusculum sp.]HJJ95578.1 GHMP kinase [Methanocorpusculum sp.]
MERRVVRAFAPGHISGYFKRIDGNSPRETGSIGAGIVIDKGVSVILKKSSETRITLKNSTEDSWLVKDVLDSLEITADVTVDAEMPIGAGFGMSAAGLLALYHAANELFSLGLSSDEISEKAHEFEVIHGTGLGDVAAASKSGVIIRTKPGVNGISKQIHSNEQIYALTFGKIATPDVIGSKEKMQAVSRAFPDTIPNTLDDLMNNSRSFAEKSGLLTERLKSILKNCDDEGVLASMTMLGDGIFAIGKNARKILEKYGHVYELHVASSGPFVEVLNYV